MSADYTRMFTMLGQGMQHFIKQGDSIPFYTTVIPWQPELCSHIDWDASCPFLGIEMIGDELQKMSAGVAEYVYKFAFHCIITWEDTETLKQGVLRKIEVIAETKKYVLCDLEKYLHSHSRVIVPNVMVSGEDISFAEHKFTLSKTMGASVIFVDVSGVLEDI